MDVDPLARDYDTLLPGELQAVRSDRSEDADLWLSVYAELCSFKQKLMDNLVEQRGTVNTAGQLEVEHDAMIFEREYGRLKRRLEFWRGEVSRRAPA